MNLTWAQYCVSNEPFHELLIPSSTTPNLFYTVTVPFHGDARKDWYCSCRGWTFRGHCKHLAMVNPCWWDEITGPEKQTAEQHEHHVCPRCYGSTFDELVDE